MKNLLTKISFVSFLLLAAISSSVQKKPIKAVMAQEATAVEKQEKVSRFAVMEDFHTRLVKSMEKPEFVKLKKEIAMAGAKQSEALSLGEIEGFYPPLRTKRQVEGQIGVLWGLIARAKMELVELREETAQKAMTAAEKQREKQKETSLLWMIARAKMELVELIEEAAQKVGTEAEKQVEKQREASLLEEIAQCSHRIGEKERQVRQRYRNIKLIEAFAEYIKTKKTFYPK